MRVPALFLRTPFLVLALMSLHFLFRDRVEDLRLLIVRALATPFSFGPLTSSEAPLAPESMILSAREALEGSDELSLPTFPVLDVDRRLHVALLAAGSDQGVELGAIVRRGGVALGRIERVQPNLSLVRFLDGNGSVLPIRVGADGRELPGRVAELAGTLRGRMGRPVIFDSFLPESFSAGDRVYAASHVGETRLFVGTIATTGVLPVVNLALDAADQSQVSIVGVERGTPRSLFEDIPLRLLVERVGLHAHAVARTEESLGLVPGSAVSSDGAYFGRVLRTVGSNVLIARPDEAGEELRVLLVLGETQSLAVLQGRGRGEVVLLRWLDNPPPPGEGFALTLGGQDLVPPLLTVGRAIWNGASLRIRLSGSAGGELSASRFRFASEREALWRKRR